MGNKKKRRGRQGVVSWITSVIAILLGLSGVFQTLKVGGLSGTVARASFGLTRPGGKFNLHDGMVIYAPMLAGIVFKTIAGELTRRTRIQSLLPKLG